MVSIGDDKLHITMFPWLAFGHMFPYLELGRQIAAKGHRVSFLSTPKNIDRLLQASPELEGLIDFVRIPLPPVDNLPDDAEATSDLPTDRIQYLKMASDILQEPVERFLESSARVDWIMYDFASYWVGEVAARVGVRSAYFNIFTAATSVFLGPAGELMGEGYRKTIEDFTVAPPWIPFQSKLALRYYEMKRIFDAVEGNASKVTDMYRLGASINNADVIMMRSSYEYEPEWIKVLEDIHKKPIFPVGQLPPSPTPWKQDEGNNHETWLPIKEWLDEQKKGTVVYIAFGSEAKPSQSELTEIALGLETSGSPFFWVLRNQIGEDDPDGSELPQGFESRVKGRGVVWRSWVPQVSILSHGSVGGFLTHVGWSSVVECLSMGKALIMFPLLNDQSLNARVLEENGIGYPVPRDELDGSFTSASVAESVRLVMVEEDGKVYRDKAMEMRRIFGSMELQEGYVERFLSYFKENKKKKP